MKKIIINIYIFILGITFLSNQSLYGMERFKKFTDHVNHTALVSSSFDFDLLKQIVSAKDGTLSRNKIRELYKFILNCLDKDLIAKDKNDFINIINSILYMLNNCSLDSKCKKLSKYYLKRKFKLLCKKIEEKETVIDFEEILDVSLDKLIELGVLERNIFNKNGFIDNDKIAKLFFYILTYCDNKDTCQLYLFLCKIKAMLDCSQKEGKFTWTSELLEQFNTLDKRLKNKFN